MVLVLRDLGLGEVQVQTQNIGGTLGGNLGSTALYARSLPKPFKGFFQFQRSLFSYRFYIG